MVGKRQLAEEKNKFKQLVYKYSKLRHIHIIGCARSGTTMLHYAMCAFANTVLCDQETSIGNHPSIGEILRYAAISIRKKSLYYITKRNAGWWHSDQVENLLKAAKNSKIFIIYVIRDPRDVLTSAHPLDKKRYYVLPEKWMASILAGEHIMNRLSMGSNFIILKYEDIVRYPDLSCKSISRETGMKLRKGITGIDKLKDNVENIGGITEMIPYMHKLRNFDERSIGGWQRDLEKRDYINKLLNQSKFGTSLDEFLKSYNYISNKKIQFNGDNLWMRKMD